MHSLKRLLGVFLGLVALAACPLRAQTTAITYQGRLTDNGAPAAGTYDFRFTIYDADSGGNAVGTALTNATVAVTNGLFTVTLDFGPGVFTGADRWLEIGVRTNGSTAAHALLAPRQAVASAPYAVQALSAQSATTADTATVANSANSVAAANVSGTLAAGQIPSLDASKVTSGTFATAQIPNLDAAKITSGTLALSQLPGAVLTNNASGVNLSGSFTGAGHGLTDVQLGNLRATNRQTYGWGDNSVGQSAVPDSVAHADILALAGGESFSAALLVNGKLIAWGGNRDFSPPPAATNVVRMAAGGNHLLALRADGSLVTWGYELDEDIPVGFLTLPASATNGIAVGVGYQHSLLARADGTVVAWGDNTYGQCNVPASATNVVAVAGGAQHSLALRADGTLVAWGNNFTGQTNIPPSATNVVRIAACWYFNMALKSDGSLVVWGDSSFGLLNVPSAATNVVAVAAGNSHALALKADGGIVVWGQNAHGLLTIPSGLTNAVLIGAGSFHSLASTGSYGPPPLARLDRAANFGSIVKVGTRPLGDGQVVNLRVVGNDGANWKGSGAFGHSNATVILGELNGVATLGGHDATLSAWANLALNPAGGNVAIGTTNFSGSRLDVNGNVTISGSATATVFNPTSDRHAKENFTLVDAREVLEKVTALPITRWNFKADGTATHLGPMAQDFQAAFGLGANDKTIATVDADGVALAAIQGLNQKLTEELQRRDAENAELKQRLEALESLVKSITK